MGTIKTTNIETITGSGTLTLGQSGETISIPSGATIDLSSATQTGVGGTNTPAWKMGMTAAQALAFNTTTKIDFDTSIIDTDSGVDTVNKRYTIPSGKGGTYIVHCFYRTGTGTDSSSFDIIVYKNGVSLNNSEDMSSYTVSQSYNTVQCTGMLDLSAGDYLEMFARQAGVSGTYDIGYSLEARFWGFKLIGV